MQYISQQEMSAIKAIDILEVEKRVDHEIDWRQMPEFYDLNILSYGLHVTNRLRAFERDLANYANAKRAAKVDETRSRARKSGHDLIWAVRDMQKLVEDQEEETKLVRIDDSIPSPYRLSEKLQVRIFYHWRCTLEDSWASGVITFVHDVDTRPNYTLPQPKKKLSAAKKEEKRQQALYEHFEHLRNLAVNAVRRFLRDGGSGSKIPETFHVKLEGYDRHLNNFSCDFWRDEASDKHRSMPATLPEAAT
jgi:hypothetical protein